jgi:hypothetical protein
MPVTYPLDDLVASYLPAHSSLVFGTNLFAGLLPDAPDAASAVFEYPGGPGIDTFQDPFLPGGLRTFEEVSLQAISRDVSLQLARTTIDTIYKTLSTVVNLTINGNTYFRVVGKQPPFFLHRDASRRVYYAVNFYVLRRPA